MSRNGSGSYTAPGSSFPAVASTLIESTKYNNVVNDIAAAITASIANDGQTPILANLPMGGFKLTGLAAGAASGDSARYNELILRALLAGDAAQAFAASTFTGAGTGLTGTAASLTSGAVAAAAFASSAENIAGTVESKPVDPLGIREAFNASGTAPVYACRAWVNFNGTGVVAIGASGNVSSITDNGVGDYTVNFTTAMSDANFTSVISQGTAAIDVISAINGQTTTTLHLSTYRPAIAGYIDMSIVCVAIFR